MFGTVFSRLASVALLSGFLAFTTGFAPTPALADEKKFFASAKCEATGKTGKAIGDTRKAARAEAIKMCIANGGLEGCCSVTSVKKVKEK